MRGRTQPLEGVVVIDFTHVLAGPFCTMLLADAGATVIKVEPTKGDFARTRGVLGVVAPGEQVSAYLAAVNRGKQSITLDLKSDSGLSLASERIGQAGLVVENFSSGTVSRLGLGFDEARTANRRLITASISLDGSDTAGGPSRLGLALIAEGEAGTFHQPLDHRESPLPISSALGDMATGLACYAAICTALLERERTGVGGHVDISMIRTLLSLDSAAVATHSLMKRTLGAVSPDDILLRTNTNPYGFFRCIDGHVAIAVNNDQTWAQLLEAIGRSDVVTDPRSSSATTGALESTRCARSSSPGRVRA